MRKLLILLCLPALFVFTQVRVSAHETAGTDDPPKRPLNVILMIGDGMGLSQITGGMVVNGNTLELERCKHIGLIKTYAADDLITDSAAGATAFATGKKTYNGAISVDTTKTAHTTILEMAHERGMCTGVVATSTIQHATPACFYAHQPLRSMYEEITLDLLESDVDIAIGGGKRFFTKRADGRDLFKEAEEKGFKVVEKIKKAKKSIGQQVLVITDKEHPGKYMDGRGEYLGEATEVAISHLRDNQDGFFLMVESSQIDWGGHANDAQYIITEMIDFDNVIGQVLDFAEQDGNTLVIITADHETGGFAINDGSVEERTIGAAFTTGHHTGTLIPVFAYGPGSEAFSGVYENTDIFFKMVEAMGLNEEVNR